jgi:hypothetical protein
MIDRPGKRSSRANPIPAKLPSTAAIGEEIKASTKER